MSRSNVIKTSDEDRFMLCVVYSPNKLPARGADHKLDVVSPRTLEKAAWKFAENGLKTGMFHKPGHEGAAKVVESYIYRNPVPWDVHGDGSVVVKEGDWLAGLILSPEAWGQYKSGAVKGVSLQGDAGRKKATAETLARQGS